VRTGEVDGFLFDRGFPVLHTAYPEARAEVDYHTLGLWTQCSIALVRQDGLALLAAVGSIRPGAAPHQ
jgi:hypothetical protein